jgi:hypothetical protein
VQPRACCWGRATEGARSKDKVRASVNEGGGGCHMCGAVSQNIPEIRGDIALPKGDARHEGGGRGKRGSEPWSVCEWKASASSRSRLDCVYCDSWMKAINKRERRGTERHKKTRFENEHVRDLERNFDAESQVKQ